MDSPVNSRCSFNLGSPYQANSTDWKPISDVAMDRADSFWISKAYGYAGPGRWDGIDTSFVASHKAKTYTTCSCWSFCTDDLRLCFSHLERRGFTDRSEYCLCTDGRIYRVEKIEKSTDLFATNQYNLIRLMAIFDFIDLN